MIEPARRLNLDRDDPRSMQTQLSGQLKRMIRAGQLSPGQRLPSTRELAGDLGISRNTVVAAYEMLLGEGYLESELRSGFRVNQAARAFGAPPLAASVGGNVAARSPLLPGLPVPFRPTQPDVNLFPLPIWNRYRNRVLKSGTLLLHYQSRFPVDWTRCGATFRIISATVAEYDACGMRSPLRTARSRHYLPAMRFGANN